MKRLSHITEGGEEVWVDVTPDPIERLLADPNLPPPVTKEQADRMREVLEAAKGAFAAEWLVMGTGPTLESLLRRFPGYAEELTRFAVSVFERCR